jgi:hypothetical protein
LRRWSRFSACSLPASPARPRRTWRPEPHRGAEMTKEGYDRAFTPR